MGNRRLPGGKERSWSVGLLFVVGSLTAATSTALFFAVPVLFPVVYNAEDVERSVTSVGVWTWLTHLFSGAPDIHTPQSEKDTGVVAVEPVATTTVPEEPARPAASGPIPAYVPVPEAVKAIYMSQCVVGTPSFRDDLVALIAETELNAVVIDVKDYTGKIAFPTEHPALAPYVSDECGARDMRAFLATLHEKGIYTIARLTVFQDPAYSATHPELAVKFANPPGAVWKDHKGLSFIDVGAKPFWEYIVALSRETHALGFDEINYDYIRYPSDGPMGNIHFDWAGDDTPKAVALEEFFAYLSRAMKDPSAYPVGVNPPIISADLFGMVTTNFDDLGIGQVLERALPYFDYIAPMVYPSHYPKGYNGWDNPNTVPYELIKYVMDAGVRRTVATSSPLQTLVSEPLYETVLVPAVGTTTATTTKQVATGRYSKPAYDRQKLRPWLQDFNYGGTYGPKEVRAQIQATYDAGLTSWMLWAPSNRYTREALDE